MQNINVKFNGFLKGPRIRRAGNICLKGLEEAEGAEAAAPRHQAERGVGQQAHVVPPLVLSIVCLTPGAQIAVNLCIVEVPNGQNNIWLYRYYYYYY
jgi:hypothetical protein